MCEPYKGPKKNKPSFMDCAQEIGDFAQELRVARELHRTFEVLTAKEYETIRL